MHMDLVHLTHAGLANQLHKQLFSLSLCAVTCALHRPAKSRFRLMNFIVMNFIVAHARDFLRMKEFLWDAVNTDQQRTGTRGWSKRGLQEEASIKAINQSDRGHDQHVPLILRKRCQACSMSYSIVRRTCTSHDTPHSDALRKRPVGR